MRHVNSVHSPIVRANSKRLFIVVHNLWDSSIHSPLCAHSYCRLRNIFPEITFLSLCAAFHTKLRILRTDMGDDRPLPTKLEEQRYRQKQAEKAVKRLQQRSQQPASPFHQPQRKKQPLPAGPSMAAETPATNAPPAAPFNELEQTEEQSRTFSFASFARNRHMADSHGGRC